jgi:hypothetical protein
MTPSLKDPERQDVDTCIALLEQEEMRQKEALRKFYLREQPVPKSNLIVVIFWLCVGMAVAGIVLWQSLSR